MNSSTDSSAPLDSGPFSFEQFNDLVAGIELLYRLGRRLSDAIANQPSDYLIQEATMAFVKTNDERGASELARFIDPRATSGWFVEENTSNRTLFAQPR
jgi:hypothetical protein